MVEPASKGASRYVAASLAVARGWERQADVADNPIFYQDGALDPTSYRAWLDSLAVAYVAVPNTHLDFASKAEAQLIAGGLPYLDLVWSNENWKLYAVQNPAPLVRNAQLISVAGNQVRLQVPKGPGADADPVVRPPGGARRHRAHPARRPGPWLPVAGRSVDDCCTPDGPAPTC